MIKFILVNKDDITEEMNDNSIIIRPSYDNSSTFFGYDSKNGKPSCFNAFDSLNDGDTLNIMNEDYEKWHGPIPDEIKIIINGD
jgi:hypothetical protein